MAINFLFFGLEENCINLQHENEASFSSLLQELTYKQTISNPSLYCFTHNGSPIKDISNKLVLTEDEISSRLVIIRGRPRLLGGKGGFGALIRAMGMHINKSRSRDASRDLNGRRIRDVNAEKQMAEWAKKEPERKKKQEEQKAKRRREMLEGPRHFFNDPKYMQQLAETEESMEEALKRGLEASSEGNGIGSKRKAELEETSARPEKKSKLWLGLDDMVDSDDSEDEGDEEIHKEIEDGTKNGEVSVPSLEPDLPILPPITEDEMVQPKGDPISNEEISQGLEVDPKSTEEPSSSNNKTSNGTHTVQIKQPVQVINQEVIDCFNLEDYTNADELEQLGPDVLKIILQNKGLKCGGTLQERAQRLFSIKGKLLDEIDPNLFAKSNGKRKGKGKAKKI